MINLEGFKDSLLEFIEFRSEPFDIDFIYKQCIQPIDKHRINEAFYQLELEGKILRLSDGRYIATRVALKKWLSSQFLEIKIPEEIAVEIEETMHLTPRAWKTIDSFVSEAIKEHIKKVLNAWTKELYRRRKSGIGCHDRAR